MQEVKFKFAPDTRVVHSQQDITGVVTGNYVSRAGVQSALVEYVSDNGQIHSTYVDEDLLTEAD